MPQQAEMPVMAPVGGINYQDHSDGNEEFVDNFAAGPQPNDPPQAGVTAPDTHPSDAPLGLGGEYGAVSSSDPPTVATDHNQNQPGETSPPAPVESKAPVQPGPGERSAETSPAPQGSEPEEFSPQLLHMAGLTAEQAQEKFSSPRDLFSAVRLQAEQWQTSLLGPEGTPPAIPVPVETPAAPATPSPQKKTVELEAFKLDEETAELLAPELVELIQKMDQHHRDQLSAVNSRVDEREFGLAEQAEVDEANRFDKAVQGLGDDWTDFFGEGSGVELVKAGKTNPSAMTHANHRSMLHDGVKAVRRAAQDRGLQPMSLEQEMSWAMMNLYPDKFAQTLPGTSGGPGTVVSRPTARRNSPNNQNDKTLSAVDKLLRERGRGGLDMGRDGEEWEGDI